MVQFKKSQVEITRQRGAGRETLDLQASGNTKRSLMKQDEGSDFFQRLADNRRERLAEVLAGELNEFDVDELMLMLDLDRPQFHNDHMRLLRAASLAVELYRRRYAGQSRRRFIKNFAAICQVEPDDLEKYALVVDKEIKHRQKTGSGPPDDLPRLTQRQEREAPSLQSERKALPTTSRFKHDPSVYVTLAEQGLNNCEISMHLADVSETSVRRGLTAAGYS
jgi:hypothetical protein